MKKYISFLLVSAVLTSVLPASLSADNNSPLSSDDLADAIRHARSCPAKPSLDVTPEKKGFFSKFRERAGNAVRWAGDQIRQEGDSRTNAGQARNWLKEKAAQVASSQVGIAISTKVFNPIGNGLRKMGQWIKGGKEEQTPTRVVLDNVDLKYGARATDVEKAVKLAASSAYKADAAQSVELFDNVVDGLKLRGHTITQADATRIFLEVVTQEILKAHAFINSEQFITAMLTVAMSKVQELESVKASSQRAEAMRNELEKAYNVGRTKVRVQHRFATTAA